MISSMATTARNSVITWHAIWSPSRWRSFPDKTGTRRDFRSALSFSGRIAVQPVMPILPPAPVPLAPVPPAPVPPVPVPPVPVPPAPVAAHQMPNAPSRWRHRPAWFQPPATHSHCRMIRVGPAGHRFHYYLVKQRRSQQPVRQPRRRQHRQQTRRQQGQTRNLEVRDCAVSTFHSRQQRRHQRLRTRV